MTSRQHFDRSDDRRGAAPDAADPWAALGPESSDDFWHDVPDWSATASTSRRTGRGRIGGGDEPVDPTPIGHPIPTTGGGIVGSIRAAWDQLLSGGADATREHRRLDLTGDIAPDGAGLTPTTDRPSDPWLDDDDDDWLAVDPTPTRSMPTVDATAPAPVVEPGTESPADGSPIRGLERDWMAQAATAGRRPQGPIDPLLVRIGAVVIIAALVLPLFVALVGGDELDDAVASAASADVVPAPDVAASAAPDAELATEAPLDPASLPPAVPVNTEVPGAAAGSDPTTSGSADGTAAAGSASDGTTASAGSGSISASDSSTLSAQPSISGVEEPAAADAPAARVDPPVCPISYTVVAGDFWLRLADAADVSLADLLGVNRATVDSPLYPGAEICLPEGATTPAPPTTAAPTTAAPTTAAPTTAAPTTAPPTTVFVEPPGPEEIKQIIRDVWPDELEERALEIAYRESRYVPTAKNFCCYGLFQIYWEVHDVWLDDIGVTSASQLFDPETNARAALALYERAGGWGPWGG